MKGGARAGWIAEIAIIGMAALALLPLSAPWVERSYANGLYPALQRSLTPLMNPVPFAVGDALGLAPVVALPLWWAVRLARTRPGQRFRMLGALSLHTLTLAAAFVLSFQLLWGWNYQRVPLAHKLAYSDDRVTKQAARDLLRRTVQRLNEAGAAAHAAPASNEADLRTRLHHTLDETVRLLGNRRGIVPGVPKTTLFNPWLAAAGFDGFIYPFTLEVVLQRGLLSVEKPFLLAHEWAHLAGFADESEANFVAWLACIRSNDTRLRYAGWLALYTYLPADARLHARLSPIVRADLRALRRRQTRRVNPGVSRFQGQVYDRFLKANRVESGIASYGQFVRLALGTRFEPGWAPVPRYQAAGRSPG